MFVGVSNLVDSEADGLQVKTLLPQLAPVLLHQGDDHAAHVVVIIGVYQQQLELRVGPKRVCGSVVKSGASECVSGFTLTYWYIFTKDVLTNEVPAASSG